MGSLKPGAGWRGQMKGSVGTDKIRTCRNKVAAVHQQDPGAVIRGRLPWGCLPGVGG